MDEILSDFRDESKELVREMMSVLEDVEANPGQNQGLEKFGQIVDRIMGAAKTVALTSDDKCFKDIANYAQLCKVVGYRASQLKNQEEFCAVVVAFLLDATEMLDDIVDKIGTGAQASSLLTTTFLDRLQMISGRFDSGLRDTVASGSQKTQAEIDKLLRDLGVAR